MCPLSTTLPPTPPQLPKSPARQRVAPKSPAQTKATSKPAHQRLWTSPPCAQVQRCQVSVHNVQQGGAATRQNLNTAILAALIRMQTPHSTRKWKSLNAHRHRVLQSRSRERMRITSTPRQPRMIPVHSHRSSTSPPLKKTSAASRCPRSSSS